MNSFCGIKFGEKKFKIIGLDDRSSLPCYGTLSFRFGLPGFLRRTGSATPGNHPGALSSLLLRSPSSAAPGLIPLLAG